MDRRRPGDECRARRPPCDATRARAARAPPGEPGKPVYLRCVGGAARVLLNQDAIATRLEREGFAVMTPEETPVDTLCDRLRARLLLSVEGSALCHGVLALADGGTIRAIQPPTRVDLIQKGWTDACGLEMAFTIAEPAEGGFVLDEDRLMRLLDLVARANPF